MGSELKEYLGKNIKKLNQIYLNIHSFIDQNENNYQELKKQIKHIYPENITSEITTLIENIISIQLNENSSNLFSLIEFWRQLSDYLGGLRYKDVSSLLLALKKLNLKNLGIYFIKLKPSKSIGDLKLSSSITNSNWINIIGNLSSNSNFINTCKSIRHFLRRKMDQQLQKEIMLARQSFPKLTMQEIEEYKKYFFEEKINFKDFREKYKSNISENKQKNSKKSSLNSLKNKEDEPITNFDMYQAYFQSGKRELARMKRTGLYKSSKKISSRVRKSKKRGDNE